MPKTVFLRITKLEIFQDRNPLTKFSKLSFANILDISNDPIENNARAFTRKKIIQTLLSLRY
ncbi:hypothetical protein LEP1GSC043_2722 [Leptospira weilii str. Ecochallenge]|uniref:Uncharacterized protein n=1 Tax=Leptospira weilii str. Ecochallenge TaxID=1049986 RepID=N1UB41_9LEPT|nr:hypothetical protein LEP1GSC043_2722 [Leptospira weilii str. Ecochallenge]